MRCEFCRKNKAKTWRREGGLIPLERIKELRPKTRSKKDVQIRGYKWVCLDCIKKKMKSGNFLKTNIITNPTIKPSGDVLEWVMNDE